ncbi:MAG: hypothetical protein J6U93_07600 [Alistipes sp.]|nr:hypothetical protein [Alistipes sp.]
MATIVESLRALNAYPIPMTTLVTIVEGRGLMPHDTLINEAMQDYRKAEADVYMWLSNAPDVSQGGQNYSFSDEQRRHLRQQALAIYNEAGENNASKRTIYGYKGTRL